MNEYYIGQFVPQLKFVNFRFETGAVTLNMRSRSNRWYVPKDLVKGDHLTQQNRLICIHSLQYIHSYSPLG